MVSVSAKKAKQKISCLCTFKGEILLYKCGKPLLNLLTIDAHMVVQYFNSSIYNVIHSLLLHLSKSVQLNVIGCGGHLCVAMLRNAPPPPPAVRQCFPTSSFVLRERTIELWRGAVGLSLILCPLELNYKGGGVAMNLVVAALRDLVKNKNENIFALRWLL